MKARVQSLLVLLVTVMMVSCSDEDTKREFLTDQNGFTLSYTLNAPESVLTRSSVDIEEGEDRLNSFYILFFENTTGGTGNFLEAIDIMESTPDVLLNTGNVNVEFSPESQLKNSEQYNMLVCGNIEKYTGIRGIDELIAFCEGKTENEITRLLLQTIQGVPPGEEEMIDNSNCILSTNLPMGAKYIKEANATQVTVELTRTLSRFDVFSEAAGYELYSTSIWNAYTEGFIWEGNFTDYTAPRTERYYGVGVNSEKEIIGSLYAFENYVSAPIQNDKVTTCLIIGLKNLSTAKVEYFRANINASGSIGQQLKRNTVYRTIVKNVHNPGNDTERGAYENDKSSLDIDVNGWIVDESGTIQVKGNNVLAMPTATARLFAQGETREYYVYTIGQGVPAIITEQLPDNIKATLKLAPGYSENSDFKKSILTFNAGAGKTGDKNYKIEVGFSTLSASIVVEQVEGNIDFIDLDPYGEIELGERKGHVTKEITVNSSGTWVAEIIQSDHLSFTSGSRLLTMEGTPGQGFSLYALEHNIPNETRYWFVSVYLKDNPEIVRNLVIAQKGGADPRYVEFVNNHITMSSTAKSTNFSIRSNDIWEAEIIIEKGTQASFSNTGTNHKLENQSGNRTPTIYIPVNYSNTPTRIIVRATVKGTDISDELLITQPAYHTGSLFISNATGVSDLVTTSSTNYIYYVYNLGVNMRNTSLFGPGGNFVDMPDGGFDFKYSTVTEVMQEARIMQFVTTGSAIFNNAYEKHQEDPSKLWIFSSNSYSITNSLLNSFRAKKSTGYASSSIVSVSNSGINYREFYQGDNMEHPLIKYLLNGPAGPVNPDEVQLQGYSTSAGGIREGNWPSTFVPIIKSTVGQNTYCVFGIDPVHRLILIMDPTIFGAASSASTSYYNRNNYVESKSSNINFLNNFIAWMAQVATEGESFLQQFQ